MEVQAELRKKRWSRLSWQILATVGLLLLCASIFVSHALLFVGLALLPFCTWRIYSLDREITRIGLGQFEAALAERGYSGHAMRELQNLDRQHTRFGIERFWLLTVFSLFMTFSIIVILLSASWMAFVVLGGLWLTAAVRLTLLTKRLRVIRSELAASKLQPSTDVRFSDDGAVIASIWTP